MQLRKPGLPSRIVSTLLVAIATGSASVPASAADHTIENLSFSIGPIAYKARRMDVRDTPLSRSELDEILSTASPTPLSQRLARLTAREIVVPELTAETKLPNGVQTSTYRDIVLSDIVEGRVRSTSAASGAMKTVQGGVETTGSFGRSEATEVDLVLGTTVLNDKATGEQPPMKKLYASFSLDKLVTKTPGKPAISIDRIAGRDVMIRPTSQSWIGLIQMRDLDKDPDKLPPEERKRFFGLFTELFSSIRFGIVEMTGIAGTSEKPGDPSVKLDRIALKGGADGQPSEFSVEGLSGAFPEGNFRLARFTLTGLDIPTIFRLVGDTPAGEPPGPAEARKLIPALGNFALAGLEVSVGGKPEPKEKAVIGLGAPAPAPDKAAPGYRLQIAGVEYKSGKPLQDIPTDLSLGLRNVSFTIPRDSKEDAAKQLLQLGYEKVDVSFLASLGYDPARQELALRELSLDGQDMGRVAIRATLGGITPDAFSPDTAIASVAVLGAAARSLNVTVSNQGLAQRLLTIQASRQGRTPEDLRREYGTMAAVGIPAMLGGTDAAKILGRAIAQFVAKPGRLTIDVKSKTQAGFGIADFAAAPDPASIFEKLDITATAE